jgi:predicted acylesterase/phospholipase RssA
VSAGAFLGFIVSTGYPIKKIVELIQDIDFGVIRNITPEAFIGFPENFGIDDGSVFRKFLESIFRVVLKLSSEITFGEYTTLGLEGQIRFRCWASDVNTQKQREFSGELTPTVKIIDALRASMCLPLYFMPIVDPITGHLLTDGAIQGNLPLHYFTDEECEDTIALGFSYSKYHSVNEHPPADFMSFVSAILSTITRSRNEEFMKKWGHKILRVPIDEYPSWNFEASRNDRSMLFQKGKDAATEWIQNVYCGSRKIKRRNST